MAVEHVSVDAQLAICVHVVHTVSVAGVHAELVYIPDAHTVLHALHVVPDRYCPAGHGFTVSGNPRLGIALVTAKSRHCPACMVLGSATLSVVEVSSQAPPGSDVGAKTICSLLSRMRRTRG